MLCYDNQGDLRGTVAGIMQRMSEVSVATL